MTIENDNNTAGFGTDNSATPPQTSFAENVDAQSGASQVPPSAENMGRATRRPSQQIMTMRIPKSGGILTLGILSIAMLSCCGPFIGPILAIIALSLVPSAMREYRANPEMYSRSSLGNVSAGKICAIIGLSLGVLMLIFFIVNMIIGSQGFGNVEEMYEEIWNATNY